MSNLSILGSIVFAIIVIAIIVEILGLFDVSITAYGSYLAFFIFMIVSILILPHGVAEP